MLLKEEVLLLKEALFIPFLKLLFLNNTVFLNNTFETPATKMSLSRHISIQIVSAMIFVCTVFNVSVFINVINSIWVANPIIIFPLKNLPKGSVCVLIPEDSSFIWDFTLPDMAKTIEHGDGYIYSVFLINNYYYNYSHNNNNTSLERLGWFVQKFPPGSGLRFVRVYGNESVFETLFSVASTDTICTFYFAIDHQTRFISNGWANSLVSALKKPASLSAPYYLGAVSPSGCVNCLFVHDTHREIFAKHHNYYPPDNCWAEWVRLIYSPCHLSSVNSVIVHSFSNKSCESSNQTSNFSVSIARGRLYVNKFIGRV